LSINHATSSGQCPRLLEEDVKMVLILTRVCWKNRNHWAPYSGFDYSFILWLLNSWKRFA